MANRFVPLRIISGYSFLQSGLTIDKIAASIKKNDYFGAGLSDYGVLYGVPSFIEEMEKINKPYLIGLSISLDYDFVLYALNEEGYLNLIKLSALISEQKLEKEDIKNFAKGTAMVLETNHGDFKKHFSEGLDDSSLHEIARLSSYSDQFFLGIEVTTKNEFKVAQEIREFASNHSYETIAFPRIRYQNKEDGIILKIVDAIEKDEKISEKEENGQYYFMTFEAYRKIYTASELENTIKLLNSSKFDFHKKRGNIAKYPVENAAQALKEAVSVGLKEKNIADEAHINRANHELEVIISMGYEDYFLIVSDYVKYAKSHHILVGPGRGSAAGSLVSYALDITEVDPLEYDLSFERFLNKARKTMPDIDVDFMDTRREEMVQYMRDKYGDNRVANIATFQTIKAKQALRDIGRTYDIPTRHIDMLSKSITDKVTLREAYKKLAPFRELVDSDKYFLDIVSLASKIEGLPRQAGLHAAGVILNDKPIDTVLPVTIDLDNHYTSQYEKDYLEEQGFLKMDFLALRNLTTIDICLELINQNHNLNLDMYHIPYKDENVISLIASGQTAGLFQIESSGMKNAIKILKPSTFDDIYTLIAIFRPGPMDNIKEFVNRKNGIKKVTYLNKDIEKILGPTYGIIIYQEQISAIAVTMAGYSPTDADLFRRAVSHKEKDILMSAEKEFIAGSIKNGYKESEAKKMFSDILKFANYGFNKSHAVVYALIASRMGYLKYYYPLEFYVALLSTSGGANDTKFGEYISELRMRNLKIFGPDINLSQDGFVIDNGLLFPLSFIKGISIQTSSKIIDERLLNGPYHDFFDFVKRTFAFKIGESVVVKLIDAGAFDKLYPSRASLRSTTKYALQFAELSFGNDGQLILDDTLEGQKQYFKEIDDPLENLNAAYKQDIIKSLGAINTVEAKEGGDCTIVGIISSIKVIKTRKGGKMMAFVKIFDEVGEIELTIFPKLYDEAFKLLIKNNIIVVTGHYEESEEHASFNAETISPLEKEE